VSRFDWEVTTWDGNRRAQQDAFMRLSFREKILELERMSEVAAVLQRGERPEAGETGPRGEPPPSPEE
jgi:hypothetical protein